MTKELLQEWWIRYTNLLSSYNEYKLRKNTEKCDSIIEEVRNEIDTNIEFRNFIKSENPNLNACFNHQWFPNDMGRLLSKIDRELKKINSNE